MFKLKPRTFRVDLKIFLAMENTFCAREFARTSFLFVNKVACKVQMNTRWSQAILFQEQEFCAAAFRSLRWESSYRKDEARSTTEFPKNDALREF
jgi:hypothetical protein